MLEHISFEVKKGEIFGLGGLVGSGRTELARAIFGLDKKESGRLIFEGRDLTPLNPKDAIRKGIGFLTEDRRSTGLVMGRPIFENISLVQMAKALGRRIAKAFNGRVLVNVGDILPPEGEIEQVIELGKAIMSIGGQASALSGR